MTDPLAKLFGSAARVKLLRLFLFNPTLSFSTPQAVQRSHVSLAEARREMQVFYRAGLLRRSKRSRAVRFVLNGDFKYLAALQALLLNAPARGEDIARRLRPAGSIKFLALTGIFLGNWEGSLDLLVVGDRISEVKLRRRIRSLEAELGKEVRYALLPSTEFLYRLNMSDKLLRDVFDYPHRIVLDKVNSGLKNSLI
jgi:hypothetical protein